MRGLNIATLFFEVAGPGVDALVSLSDVVTGSVVFPAPLPVLGLANSQCNGNVEGLPSLQSHKHLRKDILWQQFQRLAVCGNVVKSSMLNVPDSFHAHYTRFYKNRTSTPGLSSQENLWQSLANWKHTQEIDFLKCFHWAVKQVRDASTINHVKNLVEKPVSHSVETEKYGNITVSWEWSLGRSHFKSVINFNNLFIYITRICSDKCFKIWLLAVILLMPFMA